MIRSFRDAATRALFETGKSARFGGFAKAATRKLTQLNAANQLRDLASPPGNRLETLRGNRAGRYSIRINDQWRVCFPWSEQGLEDVEIVDYH